VTSYNALWDYFHCINGHTWDGPVNDPSVQTLGAPGFSIVKPPGGYRNLRKG